MKKRLSYGFNTLLMVTTLALSACGGDGDDTPPTSGTDGDRIDSAVKLNIDLSGSLQNPAFSPDGKAIVFTRFRAGYNEGVSDLFIHHIDTGVTTELMSDGFSNVNLPGSSWSSVTNTIVFSSTKDPHDEIFQIPDGEALVSETQITDRDDRQSFEPSFSADGLWIVFESHPIDVEGEGVITKYKIDGSSAYVALTTEGDNRQPNWSPSGNKILFQKIQDPADESWAIWTMNEDGSDKTKITSEDESATDAVFSNDGQFIIYSSENTDTVFSNIYKVPVAGGVSTRISDFKGYDGAPSVSPDGKTIAFESVVSDPDESDGTSIWVLDII